MSMMQSIIFRDSSLMLFAATSGRPVAPDLPGAILQTK